MQRLGLVVGMAALLTAASIGAQGCGGDKFTLASPGPDGGGIEAGAGDAPDELAPGFCASNVSKHFFCDDWDNRTDPKGLWEVAFAVGNGGVLIDGAQFRSAPSSFVAKTTKAGSLDGTVAGLQKRLGRVKDVHVNFDLFVEQYGSDQRGGGDKNPAIICGLGLGSASYAFAIESPSSATLSETVTNDAGMPTSYPRQISGFEVGKWTHVQIDLVLPSVTVPPGLVRVTIDGTVVLNDHLNTPPILGPDGLFTLGTFFGQGETAANPWTVRFDNLTLDRGLFL